MAMPQDTAHYDLVMSWLQNVELKDRKLGSARSGRARSVDITTAIGRLQEAAYLTFPDIDRAALDAFVRAYVDPKDRVPAHVQG
jgi:hypothetical protein